MCAGAFCWARLDRIYCGATRVDAAAAGFNDCRFYRELLCSADGRSIPMFQDLREEAREAFKAWLEKTRSSDVLISSYSRVTIRLGPSSDVRSRSLSNRGNVESTSSCVAAKPTAIAD